MAKRAAAGSTGQGRFWRETSGRKGQCDRWTSRAIAVCLIAWAGTAIGQTYRTDIVRPFKLVDVSGTFSVRHLSDSRESSGTTSTTSQDRTTWEEELFIRTESYIYHPGFLSMRIGGGPLLVQQRLSDGDASNSNSEALFNFISTFDFLTIKPYPVSLFYSRTHPGITTSLAGRFLTRETVYGLRGHLDERMLPARVQYGVRRNTTRGSGLDTVVDDEIDLMNFRIQKPYGDGDNIEAFFESSDQTSNSGSPALPIQTSEIQTRNGGINAKNDFGAQQQLDLNQRLSWRNEETLVGDEETEFESIVYSGDLNWRHRDDLRSTYRYQQRELDRDDAEARSRAMSAGADYYRGNFVYGASAGLSSADDVGFSQDRRTLSGSATYSRRTFFGSYRLGLTASAGNTDQQSDASRIRVVDEPVVLVSTNPVPLTNEFVASETVIVRNETKTQVYVEGLDYRLIVVGSTTSIQRLVDGNINNGETVLVEYEFETGGTVEYDTRAVQFSANASFLDYFGAHLNLSDVDNEVVAGEPTISLNSRQIISGGLSANVNSTRRLKYGGEILFTDQDEEISPFTRSEIRAYVDYQFTYRLTARLQAGYVTVDNEKSDEDVDAYRYTLGLNARLPWGIALNYTGSYLEDSGGTVPRRSLLHTLNAQWNYRRVRISLGARYVDERQLDTVRDHLNFRVLLERYF
jgi:hypothetical protein